MTGLEKILKAIEAEANTNADAILNAAKQEADAILTAAKAEADKKCAEIVSKSEMDVKAVLGRAESAAALQEKKTLLDAKQQTINNVIVSARNSLSDLSDEKYAEILLGMVKKYAHNKPGVIQFSASDRKRLPADFQTAIQNSLAGKNGASLSISEESARIDGGFLLIYGDIEENCTFDALFSAAKEELQDKINQLLYVSADAAQHGASK